MISWFFCNEVALMNFTSSKTTFMFICGTPTIMLKVSHTKKSQPVPGNKTFPVIKSDNLFNFAVALTNCVDCWHTHRQLCVLERTQIFCHWDWWTRFVAQRNCTNRRSARRNFLGDPTWWSAKSLVCRATLGMKRADTIFRCRCRLRSRTVCGNKTLHKWFVEARQWRKLTCRTPPLRIANRFYCRAGSSLDEHHPSMTSSKSTLTSREVQLRWLKHSLAPSREPPRTKPGLKGSWCDIGQMNIDFPRCSTDLQGSSSWTTLMIAFWDAWSPRWALSADVYPFRRCSESAKEFQSKQLLLRKRSLL